MTRLAIIADDLSSATDCGAQMRRSGLSVVVPLGSYSFPAQGRAPQVISVDTDSRSLHPEQAYAKVRMAAQELVAQGWTNFYKSVDSTMRGNLGAEVEAVLEVVKPDCAIIAPAFPKYGRTTVDGVQYLHGRPLHETEFGTDPTAPVREADLARRFAEGSHRKTGRVTLDQLRAGPAQIQSAIRWLLAEGVELVIVDIAEQQDLRRISIGLSQSTLRIVWVGSTGLAEFVPLAFDVTNQSNSSHQDHKIDSRPALALIGSASETTRQQLQHAQSRNRLDVIALDATRLLQNSTLANDELARASVDLLRAIEAGHDAACVVRSSREEVAATQQLGARLNLSPAQVAQRIVDALSQAGRSLVRENRISGVVATGGDTANALCTALHVQALEILGEIEAGIPIMRTVGEQSLPLVTKAGGFGSPAAIADSLEKVKQYA